MLGRFHEIGIEVADIRASVEFYEALGFTQATTGETWPHPYGVLTDGRLSLGLHQAARGSHIVTFVHERVAGLVPDLESRDIGLTVRRTGEDVFNEIGFRDPAGNALSVIEARTYSPVARRPQATSLCGYFTELSLPVADFDACKTFWEDMGFVATALEEDPYVRQPLTSDGLDLAFHRPRFMEVPLLVFTDPDMSARIEKIRGLGFQTSTALPRGLSPGKNAVLEAPEGTLLMLLTGEG